MNAHSLRDIQNKKEMNLLIGKHSDVSMEKFIIKIIRENKKKLLKQKDKYRKNFLSNQERNIFTKLKKEPEKNKTHWDNLLSEMKWMQSDFEKERKNKKKLGLTLTKSSKKYLETKHIEKLKNLKRQEQNLQKKYLNISRSVKNYWQKIEKLTHYNYNIQLSNEKLVQQQNRLIGFIGRLEKISAKVANYLGPGVNKKLNEQSTSLSLNEQNNLSENNSQIGKEDEFNIICKKNIDGTYSLSEENEFDENYLTKTAKFAEALQPKGNELKDTQINLKQPFLLNNILREYQLIGLHWLVALHDNHINGILADEMGLGKTIQTIALFAYLAANRGNWGPHLIIVPTTIIVNWEIEFKKWCPSFKILSYYGNQKERKAKRYGWLKPNSFHVCITSYKLVIQDYSIFKRKRWYYIVLDEAQNIKNFKSKRWQMLLNFKARRKLLLTGTPLQNDIMEIWSYLHFLMPNLFYSNEEFREWFHTQFYNAIHNNASLNKQIIQSLHSILRPFLLRRLKKDVEKQLPSKKEHILFCELSRRQKYLYDEYINTDITQDTLKKNDYFSIMNVLMQLRKVCNHPDLFDSRDYDTSMKSCFDIIYEVPYLVANIFEYNPMKDINLKNLKLYLLDNENLNTWDYIEMLKYFPQVPIFEVYDEITKNDIQLYQPKYLIDENDILFKKNYADNTILNHSNSSDVKLNIMRMLSSLNNEGNKTINDLDSTKQSENSKNDTKDNLNANKQFINIPLPNFICPTNIPILQNISLNNYYDMFNEIDTTENIDSQPYLKSVFNKEINKRKNIIKRNKKRILHTYDFTSRNDILASEPIYGANALKIMKISFFMDTVNSPLIRNHLLFGNKKKNLTFSTFFNKGFKYCNSNKIINIEEDNIKIYEGYSEEEIIEEEELKVENEDNNLNNVIKIENTDKENLKNSENQNIIKEEVKEEEKKDEEKKEEEKEEEEKKIKMPAKHIHKIKDKFTLNPNLKSSDTIYHIHTSQLQTLNFTPQKLLSFCDEIMLYFKIYIPKVISGGPKLILSKYSTAITKSNHSYQILYNNLHRIPNVVKYLSLFKTIKSPDRKLVEYDSGKLIRLSELLKDLYIKKSKCLIFTQMTRMLDILEIFLNVYGFTYVRLDGSTKVELRQQIVDKFNNDPKVFCFISSTRSGGIGLNLTGADSIIFYDTDWNPAMDKQAQDRCHRIGQTRTVNIYRLITLSTIEENIFKKSIQKRELNYVVMEDGKFDSENISKLNLKNIIAEGNLIRKSDAENDNNIGIRNKNKKDDKVKSLLEFENLNFDNIEDQKNIEQMLIKIEDQEDVQAMKNLSKEMLDEYEKEKNEEQFFKEDDNKSNKKLDLKDLKEKEMLDKLKAIDKFSLTYYKEEYPYKQFVKDKEAKMNNYFNYNSDNETNTLLNEDEDIDIGNESESDNDSINKMDIDRAYDLYLKKKNEIMKMFEQMETEENNNNEENL